MKSVQIIADAMQRVGSAVRTVLKAAHGKKEMIDIRREKLEELSTTDESK